MEKSVGFLVFVIFSFGVSLIPVGLAGFVVEKNSLTVTSPDSIKGNHDSAIGNFGIPQYGGSMAGTGSSAWPLNLFERSSNMYQLFLPAEHTEERYRLFECPELTFMDPEWYS